MIDWLNKLTNWQAGLIIAAVGFAVFFSGLGNPFIGDDNGQIINNVPVHSITNIKVFFEGGTFYSGQGTAPLSGSYYRPLMMCVFSLIYTLFGPNPTAYHIIQLLICTGSAIFLYLFFKYSFKRSIALFLALVFLVHPINSQVVFSIPSMQDALFFFFGILALWLLMRFKSVKSLLLVVVCLLVCILAKETGFLFILMSLLYLFWWDRKRLYPLLGLIAVPIAGYLALKANAVGLIGRNPNNAPIDRLGIYGRIFTLPAILLFYIANVLFPNKLASTYYWTYPHFSYRHFLLPLLLEIAAVGLFIFVGFKIRKREDRSKFYTFMFFSVWTVLGILPHTQIIPLDFTVGAHWIYFSMAGILGMFGVIINSFVPKRLLNSRLAFVIGILIILALGLRTATHGTNWKDYYTLSKNDLSVSNDNYVAENNLALYFFEKGELATAKTHALRSVELFPYANNYNTLGAVLFKLQDYPGAYSAYGKSLDYLADCSAINNLSVLTAYYGEPKANYDFLKQAITFCPQQYQPWLYLAALDYVQQPGSEEAKAAITQAHKLSHDELVNQAYYKIMNNLPL